jgi:hypothetical protein
MDNKNGKIEIKFTRNYSFIKQKAIRFITLSID